MISSNLDKKQSRLNEPGLFLQGSIISVILSERSESKDLRISDGARILRFRRLAAPLRMTRLRGAAYLRWRVGTPPYPRLVQTFR